MTSCSFLKLMLTASFLETLGKYRFFDIAGLDVTAEVHDQFLGHNLPGNAMAKLPAGMKITSESDMHHLAGHVRIPPLRQLLLLRVFQ